MKRWLIVSSVILGVVASCGKAAPEGRDADQPLSGAADKTGPTAAAEPPAAEVKQPDPNSLAGTGTIAGDGGPAVAVSVEIQIAEDKTVTGKLTVGETAHQITGLVDGDQLRCWLRGGADEPETVRRGMLTGDAIDGGKGGFEGDFSVSGHGGVEPVKGSWKATPK
jgi:hypothetical protein